MVGQSSLFNSEQDVQLENYLDTIENMQIRTIGPELILEKYTTPSATMLSKKTYSGNWL